MNILITGATGFLGTAFQQFLIEKSVKERIYMLCSRPVDGFNYILHNNYTYETKSLPSKIDIVICIGGFVPKSVDDQKDGLLHATAVRSVDWLLHHLPNIPEKIIFCSSVEVYGRSSGNVITETCEVNPCSLYAAQKIMCEGLIKDYCSRNGSQYQILRCGPLFGPGDKRKNCFLPGIIYQAIANKEITLTVPPETKRNYLYVKDCAKAIWASIYSDTTNSIINVVSKNNMKMVDIINTVRKVINSNSQLVINPVTEGEQTEMIYDNRKMRERLVASEALFEDAIRETFEALEG